MSKVILYNAISADGFIAGVHDETPWSDEEWAAFQDFVRSCDVCLLGRRTYEIMHDGDEFVDGPRYIVVTRDANVASGEYEKRTIASRADLPEANIIGLIGGGELNGSLASMSLIDEVILDIEPVTLGAGKTLFGGHNIQLNLQLIGSKQIGLNTVQNHYRVIT